MNTAQPTAAASSTFVAQVSEPEDNAKTFALRPFGATSVLVLKRTGNKLFQKLDPAAPPRLPLNINDGETFDALLAFIYIHAAPLPEVLRVSRGTPGEFEDAVAVYFTSLSLVDLLSLAQQITAEVSALLASPDMAQFV